MNSFFFHVLKKLLTFLYIFFWNVFYIHAMHSWHISQRIMQCVVSVLYIVIRNTVDWL